MARPQPRVVAIGDAIVDLVTPPMPPVPAVDFQGEVSRFDRIPGGNATNFALQMASLGARTTFIGCVGADQEAAFLRRAYRRGRVRAILRVDPRRPTGATVGRRGSTRRIARTRPRRYARRRNAASWSAPTQPMNVVRAPKLAIWSAKFVALPPGIRSNRETSPWKSTAGTGGIGGVTRSTIASPIATTRGCGRAMPHAFQRPCRFSSSTTTL